jgi:hypothetical protein
VSEVFRHDRFILVGAVPLFAVNSMTLDESYKLPDIGKGDASQWLGKIGYSVTVEGALIGPSRFFYKAALEALADVSVLLEALVPIPGLGGIPLVSGLTVLTDMQITSLKFTQTSQEQQSIGVTIALKQCPKGLVGEVLGQGLNMASSLLGSSLSLGGVRTPLAGGS